MGQAATNTAQERYEADQAKLRKELDGEVDPKLSLQVKPPEVNPEVYRDVVPLLFRGFLTVSAEICSFSRA
jgi:hypothetical protein